MDKFNHISMYEYSRGHVGPIMYSYTSWIIDQAVSRNIKRLYFLARDGFLLKEIAERIIKKYRLDIECRYLYCSRRSLRMPTYHLIGDEMYDLLLVKGYYNTPKSVLLRAEIEDPLIINQILDELNVSDAEQQLGDREFTEFTEKLRKSTRYREVVLEKSQVAYGLATEYLKQEGLFDGPEIVIVDSGWTGSMQRSIRQLAESCGYKGRIIGFYFGMYASPKHFDDGEYVTFYFNKKKGLKRKLMFNNNLFECMLSADHGMTSHYAKSGDKIIPVLMSGSNEEMSELIRQQHNGALRYTENRLRSETKFIYDEARAIKLCYFHIKRTMVFPKVEEAAMYGRLFFCDDTSEGYSISMASEDMKAQLKNYLLIPRILRKLFRKKTEQMTTLFWPYGVISYCSAIVRPWYRINVLLWDFIKYIK